VVNRAEIPTQLYSRIVRMSTRPVAGLPDLRQILSARGTLGNRADQAATREKPTMDNEEERDDNEQEAKMTELPPELVDIERDFSKRAGLGMWISGPGWD
jgi:hypothetical protein